MRLFYRNWRPTRIGRWLNQFQAWWSGLGLPPKVVQERLGHSSITMTMDVYGHLFPRGDDTEELAAAAQSLMVVN